MTTQQQTERDEALIAIDEAFDMLGGISDASEARDKLLVAMRALRGDEPAKPDRYVVATRAMLHAHQRAMTPPDSGWGDMSYEKGNYDHLPAFQAAAAVLRRHFPSVEVPDDVRAAALRQAKCYYTHDGTVCAKFIRDFILKGDV